VSESKGNLIHFCETHDNARLAATSPQFAKLRAAFCALTSHNGAFGFANGVEWLADIQINVHNAHSLNWGARDNMVEWLQRIHAIMEIHPSFHADNKVEIITDGYHNSSAVLRSDVSGEHKLLVLSNLNHEAEGLVKWHGDLHEFKTDLLTGKRVPAHKVSLHLKPGQVMCLTDDPEWVPYLDEALDYQYAGAEAAEEQCLRAKAMDIYNHFNALDAFDLDPLLENPKALCMELADGAPIVTTWQWPRDTHRTVMLPPNHFLLVKADCGFIAELKNKDGVTLAHEKSLTLNDGSSFALFQPLDTPVTHEYLTLKLTVFEDDDIRHTDSVIMQLSEEQHAKVITTCDAGEIHDRDRYAVCTNEHGALSQVRIGWAEVRSKYDGLLIANLHDEVPVDRHTMLSRCRVWIVRSGYSNEFSLHCQKQFSVADDGTVIWDFAVPVGEGLLVPMKATLQLHPDTNAIQLSFLREKAGKDPEHLPDNIPVTLILRPDLEDRNNHEVSKAMYGAQDHWPNSIREKADGFTFAPAKDRKLQLILKGGKFHSEPEWYYMIQHSVDRERGIDGETDLFSPGYFKMNLQGGKTAILKAGINEVPSFAKPSLTPKQAELSIEEAMKLATKQFIVKRDEFQTVIAGYPWFLDWGRDTLICLRGIIAAGFLEEAQNILLQFAKYEKGGTIPNMIRGNDDNNRETSDAPLWLFVACDELMRAQKNKKLLKTDCGDGRSVHEVLVSLATGLINGTENGISFDWNSGLIYSPSHYTWMDTNYPAGTPRKGYPIEIQAMWKYALDMLTRIDKAPEWPQFAGQVEQSIHDLFVVEADDFTYLADCLSAEPGVGAHDAQVDDALRSNQLLAVTLGAVTDTNLCKSIIEACEQLLIPGAIRSLADRPVQHPAPVYNEGHLLNDPLSPYWGHYTGDEDTRRKPAYHNGTAWTWPFPSYAEALVMVYGDAAKETAMAILGSASDVLNHGCLRQSPEVIDGNTPHTQRGCGAQAWGVTELYRMVKKIK
jgi:predicted glycogen debranching enzyme